MSSYDANFAKIDIRGVKYLKLYANDNGSNGNDHSVWADAKLIKEGYKDLKEIIKFYFVRLYFIIK